MGFVGNSAAAATDVKKNAVNTTKILVQRFMRIPL